MKIKISESKLKQIINESVRRTLRESSEDYNRFGVWDLVEELKEYLGADDLINRICGRMDPMTLSKMLRDIKSVEIGNNDDEIVNESVRRVLKENEGDTMSPKESLALYLNVNPQDVQEWGILYRVKTPTQQKQEYWFIFGSYTNAVNYAKTYGDMIVELMYDYYGISDHGDDFDYYAQYLDIIKHGGIDKLYSPREETHHDLPGGFVGFKFW
jgi:hypothetical protein